MRSFQRAFTRQQLPFWRCRRCFTSRFGPPQSGGCPMAWGECPMLGHGRTLASPGGPPVSPGATPAQSATTSACAERPLELGEIGSSTFSVDGEGRGKLKVQNLTRTPKFGEHARPGRCGTRPRVPRCGRHGLEPEFRSSTTKATPRHSGPIWRRRTAPSKRSWPACASNGTF